MVSIVCEAELARRNVLLAGIAILFGGWSDPCVATVRSEAALRTRDRSRRDSVAGVRVGARNQRRAETYSELEGARPCWNFN
jgi:hypothetical protein